MRTPQKHKNSTPFIAVLGSGTVKSDHPLYQQAMELGFSLAKAGFSICHGGYGGVMEAVARGCHNGGGKNIGITIRESLTKRNPWGDCEIQMPSWQARLFKLIEMGDAYVFLDGATGTLNELFFVWEMTNKGLLDKPIILLGKHLHELIKFLKKNFSLKIPTNFHLIKSIAQAINLLRNNL